MVGRTPEYIGKKIQATEMKLVVVYLIVMPLLILGFSSLSVVLAGPKSSILNPGPHGLSEIVYAFTSAANNNGSAFGGLTGNTDWYNTTLGLTMLFGRFFLIVPVLAIAGSLARKQPVPADRRDVPHEHAAVRRAAPRGGPHRRRAHVLPRRLARPRPRAPDPMSTPAPRPSSTRDRRTGARSTASASSTHGAWPATRSCS